MYKTLAALTACLSFAAVALPVAAQSTTAIAVADYTVFVDPPTGFAFVKLPAGWKFVGRVGTGDLSRLPAAVVTSLLPADDDRAVATVESPTHR